MGCTRRLLRFHRGQPCCCVLGRNSRCDVNNACSAGELAPAHFSLLNFRRGRLRPFT
ncbi:hypothetical protein XMIN_217 [Xanthomonas citri pv. mangiferaeindicae LMG 941]|nr:hypothetical protein XMIN_217 [Xanthomonas citri pv. mangiferaeindicae LMG 941]